MTKEQAAHLPAGTPVIYLGRPYDFGCLSQTGHAVIYEPGECNMQDSLAVMPRELQLVTTDMNAAQEVDRLRRDNANLRRRLAHLTACYLYSEGSGFGVIDREIREFGFRLVKADAYDPRIVPVEETTGEAAVWRPRGNRQTHGETERTKDAGRGEG